MGKWGASLQRVAHEFNAMETQDADLSASLAAVLCFSNETRRAQGTVCLINNGEHTDFPMDHHGITQWTVYKKQKWNFLKLSCFKCFFLTDKLAVASRIAPFRKEIRLISSCSMSMQRSTWIHSQQQPPSVRQHKQSVIHPVSTPWGDLIGTLNRKAATPMSSWANLCLRPHLVNVSAAKRCIRGRIAPCFQNSPDEATQRLLLSIYTRL